MPLFSAVVQQPCRVIHGILFACCSRNPAVECFVLICYAPNSKVTLFSIQVTCREAEQQLLASDPASDSQQQRVRQLFHRQLLVPLAQGPPALQAYKDWESLLPGAQQPFKVPAHVQQGFQKAQQAVSLRAQHEAMTAEGKPADEELLAAFLAYVKFEEVGSTGLSLVLCMACATSPSIPSEIDIDFSLDIMSVAIPAQALLHQSSITDITSSDKSA